MRRGICLSHFFSFPGLDLSLLLDTFLGKLNIPLSSTLSTFAEPLGLFLAKCSATWTCCFCFHGKQIFENLLQEPEISYLQEAQFVKLLYVLHDALISWKHFRQLEQGNSVTIITLHFKALEKKKMKTQQESHEKFLTETGVWNERLLYTGSWKHPVFSFLFQLNLVHRIMKEVWRRYQLHSCIFCL